MDPFLRSMVASLRVALQLPSESTNHSTNLDELRINCTNPHPKLSNRISSNTVTTPTSPRPCASDLSAGIEGAAGTIVIGYRGTFAFGKDGLSDVKFRKLTRILVHGKVISFFICKNCIKVQIMFKKVDSLSLRINFAESDLKSLEFLQRGLRKNSDEFRLGQFMPRDLW